MVDGMKLIQLRAEQHKKEEKQIKRDMRNAVSVADLAHLTLELLKHKGVIDET